MKKTSIAAVNRIVSGKSCASHKRLASGKESNANNVEGFWFKDNETGKYGITDKYCCVMYDHNFDLSEFDSDIADSKYAQDFFEIDANRLFHPFNDQFHDWYSDDRMDNVLVKDVIEQSKIAKKNKGNDSMWHMTSSYGVKYSIELMRSVCEALDCKTVGIYYPYNASEVKYYKPIVIIGENGMGLVMPMR